jgi:hypothetical protein
MPSQIETYIRFLEETNDTQSAYFSFTVDSTGERGIINANKEGLRLYAAELLKRSLEMEDTENGQPIFLGRKDWIISDAGYDLISAIQPQYKTRSEILSERATDSQDLPDKKTNRPSIRTAGCLSSLALAVVVFITTFYALKWFS